MPTVSSEHVNNDVIKVFLFICDFIFVNSQLQIGVLIPVEYILKTPNLIILVVC